ncbi:MAG: SPOR domain-containing protein [Thermoanaerobaculia bacterium]
MSEEPVTDDQSHYEVSLTAGQAFLAFVLLLLSLAASFAFGLMIGRGHEDDRLLAQNSTAIVDETSTAPPKKPQERIVELDSPADTFSDAETAPEPVQPARTAPKPAPRVEIKEERDVAKPVAPVVTPPPAPGPAVPYYAQLLSTSDQKKAEAFAARLIDGGFQSAYVDRTTTEKGMLFRVRVNFPTEQAARSSEPKLRTFSREVWITKQ